MSFAFPGNLLLGLTDCGFEIVITIDKEALKQTMIRTMFFWSHDNHTVVHKPILDPLNKLGRA